MSTSSAKRLAAALVAVALSAAACGTRVDEDIRRRAALAALGSGGSGVDSGSGAGGGASSGVGGGSGVGTGSDLGTDTGGGVGTPAPAGGNGGATDVGVTATTITLGNVSDLSGPVPGLFEGAVNGTLAYFAYVNSQGGVYGRTLRLALGDGQTDCGQNQGQHQRLLPKVFAFVGSFSVYDDCGARVLEAHRDVSEISYALSPRALELPNYFSPSPLPQGYPTGMFEYWKTKFGDDVKSVGTLYPNIPAAEATYRGIRAAAESAGWIFEYTRAYAPTEQNFTTDVVRMQRQGIKTIFVGSNEVAQVAQIKRAADDQNYHPRFISPLAYAEDFVKLVGGPAHAEGIVGSSLYPLFFGKTDAQNIPAVALYQQWLQKVRPNAPVNLYGVYGWTSAQLFVQALKAAGPRAERASLQAELRKVHSFDADGLLPERDPAGDKASPCYVLWRYRAGDYERVDTPPAGYRCDGRYYLYSG
jgi:ABC-type branched-subunit amino acid transport system substrate-binding protein